MNTKQERTRSHESREVDANSALGALGDEDLRNIILDIIPWLDLKLRTRLFDNIVECAARKSAGWTPAALDTNAELAKLDSYLEEVTNAGYADPEIVDDFLRKGKSAFFHREYDTSAQIFRKLLIPIVETEFDMEYHETPDEVLGVDLADCANQFMVAVYVTSSLEKRVLAVYEVIQDVGSIGFFREPLSQIEKTATEELPQFDEFVSSWRAFLDEQFAVKRDNHFYRYTDNWRREAALRLDGPDGLAKIARSSNRVDDFREWCRSLINAGEWHAALSAFEEAAH